MNVEPTPSDLLSKGFITPVSLHYVRNHGPVPKCTWRDHRVTINGLVENPLTLTMDEIYENFEHVTVTATLVCAGNRRKVTLQDPRCRIDLKKVKKTRVLVWLGWGRFGC